MSLTSLFRSASSLHALSTLGRRIRGASLTEYGMTVGLIAVLGIGSVLATGRQVEETYCRVSDSLAYYLWGEEPTCLAGMGIANQFGPLEGEDLGGGATPPPGFDDEGPLSTITLPAGASGIVPIPGRAEDWRGGSAWPGGGPGTFRVVPDGGVAAVCSGSSADAQVCTTPIAGPSEIPADPGAWWGPGIPMPVDPRTPVDLDLDLELRDAADTVLGGWPTRVVRPAEPLSAPDGFSGPTVHLGDYTIPMNETGAWQIWSPVSGFNHPFELGAINIDGPSGFDDVQMCVREFDGTAVCGVSPVLDPAEHDAIGYRIMNLPDFPSAEAFYDLELSLVSTLDTGMGYILTTTATRTRFVPADSSDDLVFTLDFSTASDREAEIDVRWDNGSDPILLDWGDGNYTAVNGMVHATHTYASDGPHEVRLKGGDIIWVRFDHVPDALVSVDSWGNKTPDTLRSTFEGGGAQFVSVPSDIPSSVTNLYAAFEQVSGNPTGMETWDVSNVTDFRRMFNFTTAFNRDISGWSFNAGLDDDDMEYFLRGNSVFSQDLTSWCPDSFTGRPDDFANPGQFPEPAWGSC